MPALSETSMKTGLFSGTRTKPRIYRFRILSSAVVRSRPFSGFASVMTLEMTLAAKDFLSLQVRESPEALEKASDAN